MEKAQPFAMPGASSLWTAWQPFRVGNRIFVDFVNTGFRSDPARDPLVGWPDVIQFLSLAAAMPETELRALARAKPSRRQAAAALAEAHALRTTLKELVAAVVAGKPVRPAWVTAINRTLSTADGGVRLAADSSRWRFVTQPIENGLRRTLAPIARSAAEFLVNDDPSLLRRCGAPECTLYFYDTSRTGGRRWCRMDLCGNRVKARAHLARQAVNQARRAREKG